MHVYSTASSPDLTEMCFCVACVICARVTHMYPCNAASHTRSLLARAGDRVAQGERSDCTTTLFSEATRPLQYSTPREPRRRGDALPMEDDVSEWLASLCALLHLTPDVLVASLVYLERLLAAGVPLLALSWRPITLGTLLLADKAWRELPAGIGYIAHAAPLLSRDELAFLEGHLLQLLRHELTISRRLYTHYYFELRTLRASVPTPRRAARRSRVRPLVRMWVCAHAPDLTLIGSCVCVCGSRARQRCSGMTRCRSA